MTKTGNFYRARTFLRHYLTAWNTTGEGIHSPYLFALVHHIMRDKNTYYCFADIERRREMLLACNDTLDVIDYGSQGSPQGMHVQRRVCDIARNHLENPKIAQLLFRIVLFMQQNEKRHLNIVELGTSLGLTTAYLAAADSRNKVVTFEGSEALLKIAQDTWKTLKLENIVWQLGNIDYTLFNTRKDNFDSTPSSTDENIDLAFIDANHTYEATKRYASFLLKRLNTKGILAIDDIHYSPDMERAWQELKQDPAVTTSMDLYHVGLLFVDPHYLKRYYKIRI